MKGEESQQVIPKSVRYVKNGQRGSWWPFAKKHDQIHFGWKNIPASVLESRDYVTIEALTRSSFEDQGAATRDFNQLRLALNHPSQHIWVTVEDGFLWWTTVIDQVFVNPDGESNTRGHFWLTCSSPWRKDSLAGKLLAVANLPGRITMTGAFRSTICQPQEADAIRRLILDEENALSKDAALKRVAYEKATANLITNLSWKDFEFLIDLILSRTGWTRTSVLGKTREGIDIEAENISAGELAFVQVKSSANQSTLNEYIERYEQRTDIYDRMIMAVHSPVGKLEVPITAPDVQLWGVDHISTLAVRLGLGSWLESKLL